MYLDITISAETVHIKRILKTKILIAKGEDFMSTLIKKLSSRKLWACIAGVALGIATALGADSSTIQTISGAVISAISLITYIMAEAKVDAASAGSTTDITAIVDKVKEVIEKATAAVTAVQATSDATTETTTTETGDTNDSNTSGQQ